MFRATQLSHAARWFSQKTKISQCVASLHKDSFKAADISILKTSAPKPLVPNSQLVFGKTFTDHILLAEWEAEKGWNNPRIEPMTEFKLSPACNVFHYGVSCFEGLKAFKDGQGKVRMFRPDMNVKRLAKSAARISLPKFSEQELLRCLDEYVLTESRWVPSERGYSLYLRPTFIGTQPSLGVGASKNAMLYVISCPVGPYYATGFRAVTLLAQNKWVRAWPGGTGDSKLGGNYAPTIPAQQEAAARGHQQILWLFGPKDNLTEVGTMNLFVRIKTKQKGNFTEELITPPLDGTILPGVTRDSALALARKWNEFKVSERPIDMAEIIEAAKENRLLEIFGTGTAAIVSPVKGIEYNGSMINVPLDPHDKAVEAGPLARRLLRAIMDIQYGSTEHAKDATSAFAGWSRESKPIADNR